MPSVPQILTIFDSTLPPYVLTHSFIPKFFEGLLQACRVSQTWVDSPVAPTCVSTCPGGDSPPYMSLRATWLSDFHRQEEWRQAPAAASESPVGTTALWWQLTWVWDQLFTCCSILRGYRNVVFQAFTGLGLEGHVRVPITSPEWPIPGFTWLGGAKCLCACLS